MLVLSHCALYSEIKGDGSKKLYVSERHLWAHHPGDISWITIRSQQNCCDECSEERNKLLC